MFRHLVFLILVLLTFPLCGCSQNTAKGAASGAAGGAAVSALGTLVTGLIFNDPDTGERVARSAVYGATVGTVAGTAAGAQQNAREAQKAQAPTRDNKEKPDIRNMTDEEFLAAVGPYNFSATLALRDCDHDEARRLALKAFHSDNRDFREASLWIQALIASESQDKGALKNLHQQLAAYNPELGQAEKVRAGLRLLLDTLHDDRVQHGLPPTCN